LRCLKWRRVLNEAATASDVGKLLLLRPYNTFHRRRISRGCGAGCVSV
jgi:hypothetical protein